MTAKTQNERIPEMLAEARDVITKLAGHNEELLDENEALRKELRVTKLAHRMGERDLDPSLSIEEKIVALSELEDTKLASIETALELVDTPRFSLGSLGGAEVHTPGTKMASSGDLDNFILSQQAYNS